MGDRAKMTLKPKKKARTSPQRKPAKAQSKETSLKYRLLEDTKIFHKGASVFLIKEGRPDYIFEVAGHSAPLVKLLQDAHSLKGLKSHADESDYKIEMKDLKVFISELVANSLIESIDSPE